MVDNDTGKIPPPEIGPFVFPALLALFGLWCFYDGWLSSDPEMQGHLLINRIGSLILLPWALIDFIRTRRRQKAETVSTANHEGGQKDDY
jgi:hypothetical protein